MNLAPIRGIATRLTRTTVLRAATGSSSDPDASHADFAWYRKLGQSRRDMTESLLSSAVERSVEFARLHPLGARSLSLMQEWVDPQSFRPTAKDPRVAAIVEEHFTDPRNDWKERLGGMYAAKATMGELHLPASVSGTRVVLDYWDRGDVSAILFAPGSNVRLSSVVYTPKDGEPLTVPIVQPSMNAGGRHIGYDPRAPLPASARGIHGVLSFRWNNFLNATRGLPDSLASLDPWTRHMDFVTAVTERAQLMARFMGDVTIKGDGQKVADAKSRYKAEPAYATMPFHNEGEVWNLDVPTSGAGDSAEMERMMRSLASAPGGIPPHMLSGDFTEGNRALATNASDPLYLRARAKQQELAMVIWRACVYAVDTAYLLTPARFAGVEDWEVEVETPSLLQHDPAATAPVISSLMSSLALAIAEKMIDRGTARRVFLRTLSELGTEVDAEEVERALAEESGQATAIDDTTRNRLAAWAAEMGGPSVAASLRSSNRIDVSGFMPASVAIAERDETPRERWARWEKEHGASGGKKGHLPVVRNKDGMLTLPDGEDVPDHAKNLKLPPAWTDVSVARSPKMPLQALGTDAKGRRQYVYSEEHATKQSAKKFERTKALISELDDIKAKNASNLTSKDRATRESAAALALIHATGIRPGSERDTKAEKQAYGATTLRAEHVKIDGSDVHLVFVGKKGKDLDIPVTDKAAAKIVAERARRGGKLFDVTDGELREYSHTLGSGKYKPKDFRTAAGTMVAADAMKAMAKPSNEKEYKQRVSEVAKQVAQKLGNTPTVALQSYIDPHVFAQWRAAMGREG